jgi:hypothetical protein
MGFIKYSSFVMQSINENPPFFSSPSRQLPHHFLAMATLIMTKVLSPLSRRHVDFLTVFLLGPALLQEHLVLGIE